MPTAGPVQQFAVVQRGTGQSQDNPQPIPVPPGTGWKADQIVTGFLAASASFANNHAVARAYLAPSARKKWKPGWAATVVGPAPKVTIVTPPRNVVPGGHLSATVEFTGNILATLTDSGQYLTSSDSQEADTFTLVNVNGQWRISHLPSPTSLILTKPDFQRDYQPRNLYFFAPSGASLVPDPVFVPQQANNAEPATGLVEALLKDPTGWLSGATRTDFPAGTTLVGEVKILGNSAVVDLGGSAAKASPDVLRRMAAQLVWTLTGTSYSTPDIKSVVLEINGVPQRPHGTQYQVLSMYSSRMPASPAAGVYYLSSSGGVRLLPGGAQPARQVTWPSGISRLTFTAIAVSPGGGQIAGIVPEPKGCLVYSGTLRRGAALTPRQLNSGTCTSLSWDNQGNIWAAAGTHVWMLPPTGSAAIPVFLPGASALAGPSASLPPSDTIAALRVAPDGVRVAMIVRSRNRPAQALLGAISRTGGGSEERTYIGQNGVMVAIGTDVTDPSSLSWYDADHVLLLGQAHGALLYDVPLTGGASVPILTPPGTVSITTEGSDLVVGTSRDQILIASGLVPSWRQVGQGRAPAYPG
jgi:hypothetical protein